MGTEQKTCEERIEAHLQSRLETISALFAAMDGDELDADQLSNVTNEYKPDAKKYDAESNEYDGEDLTERADTTLHEMPLCLDSHTVYTLQLSTGGPGDQFEFTVDSDGDITEIGYRFLDWYDGAFTRLHGSELATAERLAEFFMIGHKEKGWL